MKKRVWYDVLFLVILLGMLYGISLLLVPKINEVHAGVDERDKRAFGVMEEPRDSLDVVFLGDSLCYTGISPRTVWKKTGIASYTCAKTAQRMPEAYYLLKRVLKTQKKLKVVALETNILLWPSDTENQINFGLFEAASYYFPVFEYHNLWKPSKVPEKPLMEEEEEEGEPDKGFYAKTEVVPYEGADYMVETTAAKEIARTEKFYLNRIMNLCESRNIDFMMVSMPSPKDYNYETHNALAQLAEKHDVNYLDMNLLTEEIGIDWKQDMADGTEHLNMWGAEKASAYLADYLAETYALPDNRGQKEF